MSTPEPWKPEPFGSRWDRLRHLLDVDNKIKNGDLKPVLDSEQRVIDETVKRVAGDANWSVGAMVTRSIIKGHNDAAWEWCLIRGSWLSDDTPPPSLND